MAASVPREADSVECKAWRPDRTRDAQRSEGLQRKGHGSIGPVGGRKYKEIGALWSAGGRGGAMELRRLDVQHLGLVVRGLFGGMARPGAQTGCTRMPKTIGPVEGHECI